MTRPFIGITTWRRSIDTDLGTGRPAHTLGAEYAAPVEAAGAAVVLLPPTAGVDAVLDRLDGLVLSGGEDVDPARYGAEPQEGKTYDVARDAFEIALARGARERGLPVLAICRGLQVSNIAFGGSLIVDIPVSADHQPVQDADAQLSARHPISLLDGSRLAAVYGTPDRVVNTIHHQSIDVPAPGFRPVAWTPDGIVEAIEADDDWPLWAVQWHPEKMTAPDEAADEAPLFAAFVAAARRYAAEHAAAQKGTR
ncbi:gamma-glutamyl-gamma-aminobutyrate hydrolase family protein [Microbacterium aerolatum]|uniref:gamma-glutamyl-gamma-aminobutyrate hydrolase family protein n=1 Tax=Microbacterium aerolatum TaxID=153731 RepID=UPI002000D8BF|nr:gamma-glutamyl-gamma-aminobutyrate hydrolase family protein [Microbacterium aerolatum]MCK3769729.1 gamma-glutamyl-gamma-aminobutyrate hydrolase family protein [Microbacterium aerolatum]